MNTKRPHVEGESSMGVSSPFLTAHAQLLMMGLTILRGLSTIWSAPSEMIVRRKYGTLYFSFINWFCAAAFIQLVWLVDVFGKFGERIGWLHMHAPIGMGVVLIGFYGGCVWHGRRLWYLMNHMDKEGDAAAEGPMWSFFGQLPKGRDEWRRIRVVYEPSAILLITTVLYILHLVDAFVAAYFVGAAICLSLKNSFTWFEGWLFVRMFMDTIYRSKVVVYEVKGKPTPETKRVLSALPSSMPMTVLAQRSRELMHLSAEYAALVSPVEEPEPLPNQNINQLNTI